MQSLFSPDSKIMQYLSRLYDLAVLNVLFLLTCLPIFTIGAANAALYTVCFRMDTEKEAGVFRTYFRAFRENFRQGTALWLIFALFGSACCVNIVLFLSLGSALRYAFVPFAALLVLAVMGFSYAFPLLSQFNNSTRSTLQNALILSLAYLPRSIVLAAVNIFPWAMLLLNLYAFLQLGFLWFFLYFAAAAYCNSRVLNKVFAPYLNHKEDTV